MSRVLLTLPQAGMEPFIAVLYRMVVFVQTPFCGRVSYREEVSATTVGLQVPVHSSFSSYSFHFSFLLLEPLHWPFSLPLVKHSLLILLTPTSHPAAAI